MREIGDECCGFGGRWGGAGVAEGGAWVGAGGLGRRAVFDSFLGGGGGGPPFRIAIPSTDEPRFREYEYLGADIRLDEEREETLPLLLLMGGGGAFLTPLEPIWGVGGADGGTN